MSIWKMTLIYLIIVHVGYWLFGAALIGRCEDQGDRVWTFHRPHWYAAYFIGLVVNCIAAFVANQFMHVVLTPLVLCVVSLALAALMWGGVKLARREETADGESIVTDQPANDVANPWSILSLVMLSAVASIFASRHGRMLWKSLDADSELDCDSFVYHLPFGRMISEGHFPSEIGRSVIFEIESAYPPLFYFVYGLNAMIDHAGFDLTFAAPKITVFLVNAFACLTLFRFVRDRLGVTRQFALMAVFPIVLTMSTAPNLQALTTLYLMLGLYYSWPWLNGPRDESRGILWAGVPGGEIPESGMGRSLSYVVGAMCWVGCYWTNYVGLVLVGLFLGGVTVVQLWSLRRGLRRLTMSAGFRLALVIVAVLIAPHLLRNWMVIGNPIYPALGGHDMTAFFLEHRVGQHIDVQWKQLSRSFVAGLPLTPLLIGALASVFFLKGSSVAARVVMFILFAGFCLVWVKFLHIRQSPFGRYLYPISVPAAAVVAAHWDRAWRDSDRGSLVSVLYPIVFVYWIMEEVPEPILFLVAVLLIVVGLPLLCLNSGAWTKDPVSKLGTGVALAISFVALTFALTRFVSLGAVGWAIATGIGYCVSLCVTAWIIGRVRGGPSKSALNFSSRVAWALMLSLSFAMLSWRANVRYFNGTPRMKAAMDFVWMNTQLPQDAVVMTFETRLFTLDRKVVPADSLKVEPFYLAQGNAESAAVLRKLGVTHIYISSDYSWKPFDDHPLITSARENPFFRLIHQTETGWVAELVNSQRND